MIPAPGILIVVPFELSFLELDATVRRDVLRFDLFVDCMFVVDIFLKCVDQHLCL